MTGASSGIGAATARALAAEGYAVCVRRPPQRPDRGARRGDRRHRRDLRRDLAGVGRRPGRRSVGDTLHVLVNNAGGAFGLDPVAEADPEDWRRMYEVNVLGLLHVTQALLPALRASGDGLIVNVGSTAGRIAYEGGAGYTAAKHGTQVVTETLRLELVGEPIRISEIAPGHGAHRRVRDGPVRAATEERADGGVRRRTRPAGGRGRRRRDRLDRHPARRT